MVTLVTIHENMSLRSAVHMTVIIHKTVYLPANLIFTSLSLPANLMDSKLVYLPAVKFNTQQDFNPVLAKNCVL